MQWLIYAVGAALGFAGWAFFGKLALRHATWAQVGLIYGAVTVLLFAALLLGPVRQGFAASSAWPLAASGVSGAAGLVAFYLALDRGNASIIVPLVSVYPLITAVLAVAFLNESLSSLQLVGVGCALAGVVMIGLAK